MVTTSQVRSGWQRRRKAHDFRCNPRPHDEPTLLIPPVVILIRLFDIRFLASASAREEITFGKRLADPAINLCFVSYGRKCNKQRGEDVQNQKAETKVKGFESVGLLLGGSFTRRVFYSVHDTLAGHKRPYSLCSGHTDFPLLTLVPLTLTQFTTLL